ncbi:hypothetical protein ACO0SA_000135 [Hanseniaspora valbyensis]
MGVNYCVDTTSGQSKETLATPLIKYENEFIKFIQNNQHLHKLYKSEQDIRNDINNINDDPDSALKLHVVISNDSLYHKFRRNWTSKSFKKSIVERPERLLACCMGVAAAISMFPKLYKIVPVDAPYDIKLFQTVLEQVKNIDELNSTFQNSELLENRLNFIKEKLFSKSVTKIHDEIFLKNLVQICEDSVSKLSSGEVETSDSWNSGDMYLSLTSLDAIANSIQALEESTRLLYEPQLDKNKSTIANRTFTIVRPPGHHCHKDKPEGFCLLNNAMITAQMAADKYNVTHVAILDYDLHHADGTQDIIFKRGLEENKYITGEVDIDSKIETGDNKSRKGNYSPMEERKTESLFSTDSTKPETNKEAKRERKYDTGDYLLDNYGVNIASFSMHDINSYPVERGYAEHDSLAKASACVMAQNVNVWNIHLAKWQKYSQEQIDKTSDPALKAEMVAKNQYEFMKLYDRKYRTLFAKADEFFREGKEKCNENNIEFKGLVIISSGFDANEYETSAMNRHGVNLPTSFYNYFTKDALNLAQYHTEGKIITLLEGGYDSKSITAGTFSALTGLQNQEWINEWGSSTVIKELVKGCKADWKPYKTKKNSNQIIKNWAESVIHLGRSMIFDFEYEFYSKVISTTLPMYTGFKEFQDIKTNDLLIEQNPLLFDKNNSKLLDRLNRSETTRSLASSHSTRSLRSSTTASSSKSIERNKNIKDKLKANTILTIPFNEEEEDEDDEEYVYNEELEKSFNKTIEDISVMDMSRQLETLDVSMADTTTGTNFSRRSERSKPSGNMFMSIRRGTSSTSEAPNSGSNANTNVRRSQLRKQVNSIKFDTTPHDDDDGESLMDISINNKNNNNSSGKENYLIRSTRSGRAY